MSEKIEYWNEEKTEILRIEYRDENGNLHREDGPALVQYFRLANGIVDFEVWYTNGRRNRLDGPAQLYYTVNREIAHSYFWIDGHELNKSIWECRSDVISALIDKKLGE